MIPWHIELLYLLGVTVISAVRAIYHSYISKKEGRSVTTMKYWILTIIMWTSVGAYGYFIGSLAMILSFFGGLIYTAYHMNLEWSRK